MVAPTKIPSAGFRQPISIVDEDGNEVPLVFDGAIYRLPVDAAVTLGPLASVAINDAGAGVTEVSVKPNGTAITAGSLLVGIEDTAGDQQSLKGDVNGRLQITDENGALLGSLSQVDVQETTELANVDIFPADGTAPRDGIIDIEFVGDLAGVWSLKLVRSAVTRVAELAAGASIAADLWQAFAFPVKAGDTYNLRVDAGMDVSAMISFRDR